MSGVEMPLGPQEDDPRPRSLIDVLTERADATPSQVVVERRHGGLWLQVDARTMMADVAALARRLTAAGVAAGDRVLLMADPGYEWLLIELATWAAGAVSVPVDVAISDEALAHVIADCSPAACIVADQTQAARATRSGSPRAGVWVVDPGPGASPTLGQLPEAPEGRGPIGVHRPRATRPRDRESLAAIAYTSGATGRPTGWRWSHQDILTQAAAVNDRLGSIVTGDARVLILVPPAGAFGHLVTLAMVRSGVRVALSSPDGAANAASLMRPTGVVAAPSFLERLIRETRARASRAGRKDRVDEALLAAAAYGAAAETGDGPTLPLRIRRRLRTGVVHRSLQQALGGEVQWLLTGGALLPRRIGHTFRGLGFPLLQGYGLAEATGIVAITAPPADGSLDAGPPLPGIAVRQDADGQILVRGDVVRAPWDSGGDALGAVDSAGWLRTGDIGAISDDGRLVVHGRAGDLARLSELRSSFDAVHPDASDREAG